MIQSQGSNRLDDIVPSFPKNVRLLVFFLFAICAGAQDRPTSRGSALITSPLPDPLILNDGRHVDSGSVWRNQRCTELIELFAENEYGHTPTKHLPVRFKLVSKDEHALGGKAVSER